MTRPDSFTVDLPDTAGAGDLLGWLGIDAVRWARVFQRSWAAGDCDQLGTLIGWFANAIEAGRDAGRPGTHQPTPASTAEAAQAAADAFRADPPHPTPVRGPGAASAPQTHPDRPALDNLRQEDRGSYGRHEVLATAAALAIVEAIDALAVTVRQMAAVLEGTQQ